MKRWILGLGGALLALAFWILGRDARQLRRTEAQRDALIATGANEHKKQAQILAERAERQKAAATEAAKATEQRLEKLSESNPDMDDLVSAWESERVRQQSD
jgi:F0F1-type ATP synthase epsilon subunit